MNSFLIINHRIQAIKTAIYFLDSARLPVVVTTATHDGVSMTLIYRQIVNHSISWGRLGTRQMTAQSRHDLFVREMTQKRVQHGRKMD
ncbi:hypothetical protein MJO29_010495 [Puccinia striiformis f. sp. tritici]|uniref:hypothetical protein n=1 Tax=Puccinia striiformis f. sp. tritici TaxID=168172 RepID=UPI0020083D0D|nr:hypothetical protein Pst134EA_019569 [Puccinia striiformis f. sp. tritici]KAI9619100.1 hypothetical protein KEM48_006379 [Puccinia striiformis f. sp. tritici PST-130]KAH9449628.1 hypothetical protein Pst134EB_020446 [Puccinia striiformis f. sp. tritici]KAH9449629.1 hypothetical protein Pst134EB_020447 [Puccinia striiformis f. sp. tritici]KAH9459416.1 hypothetical protein Pst134EA_019569 [Puccinia striiformis f. sp. tritici]KAI7948830.1 hypothetical protein MJO29_010495 [Puccinia striiformis